MISIETPDKQIIKTIFYIKRDTPCIEDDAESLRSNLKIQD